MRDLNYHIHSICLRNSDGSMATKSNRHDMLQQAANDLHGLGFKRIRHPQNLKPKHIYALLKKWDSSEKTGKPIAVGTIKNRMTALRWLAEKIGNPGLIKAKNSDYGIENRSFVGVDKSIEFTKQQLGRISDRHAYYSACLQREFGLRREEAIKFSVGYADKGEHISLKPSWCKGGRGRDIPVVHQSQRDLLNAIRSEIGTGSLIPNQLKYINQLNVYVREMGSVGLGKTHGARHAYAQRRYTELSKEITTRNTGTESEGFLPPAKGGLNPRHLNEFDKCIDRAAREILSLELGHFRIQIVANYLG